MLPMLLTPRTWTAKKDMVWYDVCQVTSYIRPLGTTCEGSRMQQAWACCDGVVRSVGMVIGLWCRVGSFRLIATDGG